jgi:hypothetical protein
MLSFSRYTGGGGDPALNSIQQEMNIHEASREDHMFYSNIWSRMFMNSVFPTLANSFSNSLT